jgi:hypothetical protein
MLIKVYHSHLIHGHCKVPGFIQEQHFESVLFKQMFQGKLCVPRIVDGHFMFIPNKRTGNQNFSLFLHPLLFQE